MTASAQAQAQSAGPMTFSMETDVQKRSIDRMLSGGMEDVFASGEITSGTTARLLTFLRENDVEDAKIHFDSPGGSLVEGILLGRAIRELGLQTTVGVYREDYDPDADLASICASACAYAFAGGTSRFLSEYTGRLGVHQFYSDSPDGISGEAVQQVSGAIVAYLDEMGIDAKAFALSTLADRSGMVWLTPDDALALRFANNGSEPPTAEVRLTGMSPYLRLEQNHHDVTSRVLINCRARRLHIAFGVVTEPTFSGMVAENQQRSYLEIDGEELLVEDGDKGAEPIGSGVWINRVLSPDAFLRISRARVLAGWVDGFGAVRYGATMEMPAVRDKLLEFKQQCDGS